MQPKTIIFIGPQGSGKGTQIELLKQKLSEVDAEQFITHVQTGKPFRELAAAGGYTADIIKALLAEGQLVPNVLTNAFVVKEFVDQHVEGAHIIFDGYPRDKEQAHICVDLFKLYDRPEVDVVYLDTEESVVVERMLDRGRDDDTEDIIAERLRQYREYTEPLLDFYREQPGMTVHTVNGGGTEEEVQAAIQSALNI